ncbi:hypothetical protein YC2023_059853 [Brassica napus]
MEQCRNIIIHLENGFYVNIRDSKLDIRKGVHKERDKASKKLHDEKIKELREIFWSFDRNKDESSLIRALGIKPSPG